MFSVKNAVVALVLHLHHERIVFGAVVGVVEGRRHRVLVRGIGLAMQSSAAAARRIQRYRRGTRRSRRSADRRESRAGPASRGEPSARSEMVTRTTALRSFPSSASAANSSTSPPERHVNREGHHPGRREILERRAECRRGSCRTTGVAASSAGSTARAAVASRESGQPRRGRDPRRPHR